METGPVVSPWIVFPLAMVALVVVAAHVLALRELAPGEMPESRRQIRLATGWVMMLAVPVLAFGFGAASPGDKELFRSVWLAGVGLLGAVILLAMIDALNSVRLAFARRRELRRAYDELLELTDEHLTEPRG